jgi:membrane-bound ClpP family serine protease
MLEKIKFHFRDFFTIIYTIISLTILVVLLLYFKEIQSGIDVVIGFFGIAIMVIGNVLLIRASIKDWKAKNKN